MECTTQAIAGRRRPWLGNARPPTHSAPIWLPHHGRVCRHVALDDEEPDVEDMRKAAPAVRTFNKACMDRWTASGRRLTTAGVARAPEGSVMSSCPAQIRPGVFLGSATHAHDEAALRALEITDVLNTTREIPNAFEQAATAAAATTTSAADASVDTARLAERARAGGAVGDVTRARWLQAQRAAPRASVWAESSSVSPDRSCLRS